MSGSDDDGIGLVIAAAVMLIILFTVMGLESERSFQQGVGINPQNTNVLSEQQMELETHNIALSPYNMTNVIIETDGKAIDKDSYDISFYTVYKETPLFFWLDDYSIYLDNGDVVSTSQKVYRSVHLNDRVITWHYPNEYGVKVDVWRNDALVYRRLGLFSSVKPPTGKI